MLTVDLVTARRRGDRLYVTALNAEKRRTATMLADKYLSIMEGGLGQSRHDLDEACAAIHVHPQDKKLSDGLLKLVSDRCEYDVHTAIEPAVLRREVFDMAATQRPEANDLVPFRREQVLEPVAASHNISVDELDSLLYADLKDAHTLLGFKALEPPRLVALYEQNLNQAVLLKAAKVQVDIHASSPEAYRQLFFKLKFLGLMHSIDRTEKGFQIHIDGPASLFGSGTKYGLKLALMLPILNLCDSWKLKANVIWGKDRRPLVFLLEKKRDKQAAAQSVTPEPLPNQTEKFVNKFKSLKSPWEVTQANHILDLPGVGLCIPDLLFKNTENKKEVFFEVMGFWSRDAVWKRVELVESGLPFNIIFAVSSRLRVSEEVLSDDQAGSLYVYKGTMNPKRVLELL